MRDEGFQLLLGQYTIAQVNAAFMQYLRSAREIPTPADIIQIIDPDPQPLCGRYYSALMEEKRNNSKEGRRTWFSDEQIDFIHRYEQQELTKK